MTNIEKSQILERAKEVFFKAMLDGYAGDKKMSTNTISPDGYKTIEFIDGEFRVVDRYCITPLSDYSAGTTTIFFKGSDESWVPVWWMSYGGVYPKGAIQFLKMALQKAYVTEQFCGGRGLENFQSKISVDGFQVTLEYRNVFEGNFVDFEGVEEILQIPLPGYEPEKIGYHEYSGMSLL